MSLAPNLYNNNNAGAASVTTSAKTPDASSTLIAFVSGIRSSADPGAPTITDNSGGALTWTPIVSTGVYTSGTQHTIGRAFYAVTTASPPANLTVTGSSSSAVVTTIVIGQCAGITTDFSNNNFGTNANGDPSCVLSAPGAGSAVLSHFYGQGTAALTQQSGATKLLDVSTGVQRYGLQSEETSPGTTWGWTSTNGPSISIAVELKAAAVTYTATAASTMAPATSAAVATETFSAAAASTMAVAVSGAVATETFSAAAASTMRAATSAAVATQTFSAAAASTMAPATSASVAAEVFSAAAVSTMAPAVSGAVATQTFSAAAASAMAPATSAAAAVETVPGVFAAVAASTMAPARSAATATFTSGVAPVEVPADLGGGYVPPRQARVITARLALTIAPPQVALVLGKRVRLELTAPVPTLHILAHRGPTPAEEHHARLLRDDERLLELLDMAA